MAGWIFTGELDGQFVYAFDCQPQRQKIRVEDCPVVFAVEATCKLGFTGPGDFRKLCLMNLYLRTYQLKFFKVDGFLLRIKAEVKSKRDFALLK